MDISALVKSEDGITPDQRERIRRIDWPGILSSAPNMYYEFICLLINPSSSLDERITFIEGVKDNKLSMIRNHPLLTRAQEVFKERQRMLTTVVEGATTELFICPKCGQRKASYLASVSTRSGDEAQSVQLRCVPCGTIWFAR
jgi:DNA-directed RNA polymerase subunit M/transcription elongation factor TFIIS